MKTFSVLALFLLIQLFGGCGGKENSDTKIKYSIKHYENKFGSCDSSDAGCAKVLFEYPEINYAFNSSVEDSISNCIQQFLISSYSDYRKTRSLDSMTESFFSDYENNLQDVPNYSLPWEINNTIVIVYNDRSIVSLQSVVYSFTGGAHGNEVVYFANLNSQSGKRLQLSDLLVPRYKKEIDNIGEKIFRKDKALEAAENLEDAGYWFQDNKFTTNENFGIKTNGLVFYFNSYEIAPYAMGPAELFIPYSEIKNLIKKDGSLIKVAAFEN